MTVVLFQIAATVAQDYEVSDIQCSGAGSAADLLTAKIKRPVSFRGAPLFADDRSANPLTDIHCQIRPDPNDPQEDNYFLKVTDFSRCGILKRNVSHRDRNFPFPPLLRFSPRSASCKKKDRLIHNRFRATTRYIINCNYYLLDDRMIVKLIRDTRCL